MLESVLGRSVGLIEVAAAQPITERRIGVARTLEMLQVRERAGRSEFVMDIDVGRERIDLIVDRGQLLVCGDDESDRPLGDMRIGREDDGHRLADEADLLVARIG